MKIAVAVDPGVAFVRHAIGMLAHRVDAGTGKRQGYVAAAGQDRAGPMI